MKANGSGGKNNPGLLKLYDTHLLLPLSVLTQEDKALRITSIQVSIFLPPWTFLKPFRLTKGLLLHIGISRFT